VVERDDGFRRLDEPSLLEVRGRARRGVERLETQREDLAPRGVGAILDGGIDALRARFLPCFGASLLLWIFPAWLMAFEPPEQMAGYFSNSPSTDIFATLLASLIHTALSTLVQILATILVCVIVRAEFIGEALSLGAAWSLVARRTPAIIGCTIVVGLLSIAGFVLCILPYFYVLWRVSLAPLACATEEQGPIESVRRSFLLTKGSFLRWAAIMIVVGVLLGPLAAVAGAAAQGELREAALENLPVPTIVYELLLWIASTLFYALSTATTAAITTSYYYDCRVRREGIDLGARLDAIAGEPLAGATA